MTRAHSPPKRSLTPLVALAACVGLLGCYYIPPEEEPEAERTATSADRQSLDDTAVTMAEMLQGQFPGVVIRDLGRTISVQIRGPGSINASNEALIVIDGVQSSGMALATVNPEDVESVEIIKDGAAAMYGVRGANGVLLIRTRRY